MSNNSSHFTREIFHRIYWYAKRNVDRRVIAHTLKIPLKIVEHIIDRFLAADRTGTALDSQAPRSQEKLGGLKRLPSVEADFLDVFLFVKTRYSVLDISGMATKINIPKLTSELNKLRSSDFKVVAIRLTDVSQIDEDGLGAIIDFYDAFKKMNRYTAVLDPSTAADAFLAEHDREKKLPIFGTETAFEAHAFR